MSNERKKVNTNERVMVAKERKQWIEENRRIDRMEYEACMGLVQKRKRSKFLALAASLRITTMQLDLVI